MKITNSENSASIQNAHGIDAKQIFSSEHGVIMYLKLHAKESLKPHITPVDVAFYILEGNPTIMIGKEKKKVKKDVLIESPKDIPHCIYNETNSVCRILVIKLPKPTSKTIFVKE